MFVVLSPKPVTVWLSNVQEDEWSALLCRPRVAEPLAQAATRRRSRNEVDLGDAARQIKKPATIKKIENLLGSS